MRKLVFALLLLAAGCGTLVQTYEGPKRPTSEVAVLKTNVGELSFTTAWIDLVDGRDLVIAYSELEVLPGRRTVRVAIKAGFLGGSRTLSFDAVAGRSYRVRGLLARGGAHAWLEDERTGELVAGEKP